MVVCTGRGDNGSHCCTINGQTCEFLVYQGDLPRCSLWNKKMIGNPRWERAPVGRFMAERHPGYDCKDWPQRIPEVMAEVESGRVHPNAICCWQVMYG